MDKPNRGGFAPAACLLVCGALLILSPAVDQIHADSQDAQAYKEIAASARGPDITASETAAVLPPVSTAAPAPQEEAADIAESEAAGSFSALLTDTPAGGSVNLSTLKSQNRDFAAWLHIPGTVIDYPVVRSDDADYYLHHLFSGEKSKLGCLFSLTTSDYETPSRNTAIYPQCQKQSLLRIPQQPRPT